jgi:hypothetical protein
VVGAGADTSPAGLQATARKAVKSGGTKDDWASRAFGQQ